MVSRRVVILEGCYLLHFDSPVYGAQHYLGFSVNIARRTRQHLRGRGARLVRQALSRGIGVELVRVWPLAQPRMERALKKTRTPKSYCPKCRRQPPQTDDDALKRVLAAVEGPSPRKQRVAEQLTRPAGRA
jgi:hypothetical protein